jgi:hypothetical protein
MLQTSSLSRVNFMRSLIRIQQWFDYRFASRPVAVGGGGGGEQTELDSTELKQLVLQFPKKFTIQIRIQILQS